MSSSKTPVGLLPDPVHAPLAVRATHSPGGRQWIGNYKRRDHHGLISLNEVPCFLALYWQGSSEGQLVHVGTYELNIRHLVEAGYAIEKAGLKARLRFVRAQDGTVEIRVNNSTPGLPVGYAPFE